MNKGHRTLYDFGRTTDRLWILDKEALYALVYFRSTVGQSYDRNRTVCGGLNTWP